MKDMFTRRRLLMGAAAGATATATRLLPAGTAAADAAEVLDDLPNGKSLVFRGEVVGADGALLDLIVGGRQLQVSTSDPEVFVDPFRPLVAGSLVHVEVGRDEDSTLQVLGILTFIEQFPTEVAQVTGEIVSTSDRRFRFRPRPPRPTTPDEYLYVASPDDLQAGDRIWMRTYWDPIGQEHVVVNVERMS